MLSVHEGGKTTTLRVDLYKHGCFILEAKQGSNPGDAKAGHGKRGSEAWNKSMQNAYGQAVGYARSMDEPPPFLVVCDIGYVFELYADFDRSGYYRPFPNAQKHRRFVADLEAHAKDLRALFLDPLSLDPARAGIKVTREIAEDLAQIAKLLEGKGHAPTLVAKFLMRCLFTMFAKSCTGVVTMCVAPVPALGFLDGFAALGVLTAFEGAEGKRWRAAGRST